VLAQSWVAKDYPGTKVAFTEYNWSGTDSINGALAQADLLGIFGRYGLDMATLWWNTYDAQTAVEEQLPVLMAFEAYRNYDGKNSMFGDIALASTSANQGMLSVYGALRSSDNAVTVVVINKTYGDLTSTISVANLRPKGPAKVFLYSNANLATIVAQPDLAVTPPASRSATSTSRQPFPHNRSLSSLCPPRNPHEGELSEKPFIRVESGTFVANSAIRSLSWDHEAGLARAIRRMSQLRHEMETEVV